MTPRLLIAPAIAVAGLAAAGAAFAQAPADDVCSGLATPAEEIACLRGALQESRAARAQEREAVPDTPRAAPPVARREPAVQAPAQQADQLGAEQVAAARPGLARAQAERMQALATALRTDHLGLVTLRLDNGQVWQQTEARGVPLRLRPDSSHPVEVSASGFGGYRMHFTEMDRQIVVKRLQ